MQITNPEARILFLIKGLDIGNANGGAERFSIDLANALRRDGLDVSICVFFRMSTPAEEEWSRRLDEMGIPFFFVSEWKGNNHFGSYLKGLRALKARLSAHPVSICHSHFQLGTIAALYLKASGLTRHALRTCQITQEWEAGFYGWLREQIVSKWIFPLFLDIEVGVSQAIVDRLNTYPGTRLARRKPIVIYNAIPEEMLDSPAWQPSVLHSRPTAVVGVIGRLSAQKGHRYLVDAIPNILKECPDVEFWFIGEGELRHDLEEQVARSGLIDKVKFLGRRDDVASLYQTMDLMVLPSLWEGLPIVVLESFAQGVPVIATDIPGTRELVTNAVTGWLVRPADPISLADGILTGLKDEAGRGRVRESARKKVENFSVENIAGQYRLLYDDLLADKARQG